jgi:peptide chain release factor 2
MLKARLYELGLQKREAERRRPRPARSTSAGHQIRWYVLQPYQMGKDLRTGAERSDPQKVLDGDLEFRAASLVARVGEGGDKQAA